MKTNKTFKLGTMCAKTFEFKRQMVNYYNKLSNDPRIDVCFAYRSTEYGYIVTWEYNKAR